MNKFNFPREKSGIFPFHFGNPDPDPFHEMDPGSKIQPKSLKISTKIIQNHKIIIYFCLKNITLFFNGHNKYFLGFRSDPELQIWIQIRYSTKRIRIQIKMKRKTLVLMTAYDL